MKIVIMGGGKLGAHLAENMLESKHTVRLIERDKNLSLIHICPCP